jgi:glycosyltransferase involved in cell wall biosynthesis
VTTSAISLDWLLGPQLLAFEDAGYEVIGVSGVDDHVAALDAAGIRHVALTHATRAMAPTADLRALVELRGLLARLAPDIVHTHNPKPGLYGRVAARLAGVPVVVNTVHGLLALPEDPWTKRAVVCGLERAASVCSHAELVQNPEDLELLARWGVPRTKLHLLGNGIDLNRFDPERLDPRDRDRRRAELGVGPDDVVVGVVGRLVAEKGYRDVFAAATMLRCRPPGAARVRFVVIGPDDPTKADAITAAEQDDATRHGDVVFLGARDDMERWYGAFDLYALASRREGWPRSAMEAAAMGLPIVATDIRGCRQVVAHGDTGLLVPVRDAVALAEAVRTLADDAGLRARMAAAARQRARDFFDQRSVIDLTLATYQRLLAGRRPVTRVS